MSRFAAIKVVLAMSVAAGGYHYYQGRAAHEATGSAATDNGFVTVPPITGSSPGTVMVVAAQNCPHEDAQRADDLARSLSDKGIPVLRTHELQASVGDTDSEEAHHLMSVMNGPLPAVFINGRAKSNPAFAEVVAEFNRP